MKVYTYVPGEVKLPLFVSRIPAGFPSPAEDYKEARLSLDELIIDNPLSTFFAKTEGDSMIESHVVEGDIAVIDKSVQPVNNDHVLVYLEGKGFTIKRYFKNFNGEVYLCPSNKKYHAIKLTEFDNARLWGVVIAYVRKMK